MTRRRILLVEDHALVSAGLRALVEKMGHDVIGEVCDGEAALNAVRELKPDLVLLDLSLPKLSGLEVLRRITKLHPNVRVLVLTMHAEREYVRQSLAAGATGYLLKTADREELKLALATLGRGQMWISPAIAQTAVDGGEAEAEPELTARQREVLQLIADGVRPTNIARRLRISVKTVESHRAQIMERLGIRTTAGLVRYALRTGIIAD